MKTYFSNKLWSAESILRTCESEFCLCCQWLPSNVPAKARMTTYRQEIKISECYVVNNSLNHQKQFLFTAVTLLIVSKGCKAVSVILVIISNAIITMVLQVSVGYDVMDPVCSLKRDRPVPQIFALCVKNIQKKDPQTWWNRKENIARGIPNKEKISRYWEQMYYWPYWISGAYLEGAEPAPP